MDAAGDKLMSELRAVVAAAEELLAAAGSKYRAAERVARPRRGGAARGARAARRRGRGDRGPGAQAPVRGAGHRGRGGPRHRRSAGAQMSAGLLESAQSFVGSLLNLGRTRFELFSTELREELARLATAVIGGLAVLVLRARPSLRRGSAHPLRRRREPPHRDDRRRGVLFPRRGRPRLAAAPRSRSEAARVRCDDLRAAARPQHDQAMNRIQGLAQRREELVERSAAQRTALLAAPSRSCARSRRSIGWWRMCVSTRSWLRSWAGSR